MDIYFLFILKECKREFDVYFGISYFFRLDEYLKFFGLEIMYRLFEIWRGRGFFGLKFKIGVKYLYS